jgi:hypothetical protein
MATATGAWLDDSKRGEAGPLMRRIELKLKALFGRDRDHEPPQITRYIRIFPRVPRALS